MKTINIDWLNVGLIGLSLLLAFKLPFELFLFSYAVLGPLHYVTEINWLKGKNYFVKQRSWVWIFVVASALISLPPLLRHPFFSGLQQYGLVKEIAGHAKFMTTEVILVSLLFAIGCVYLQKPWQLFLFLIAALLLSSLIVVYVPFSFLLVSIFIPTIVHVYLFTLLFMIFGTINNRSGAGVVAAVCVMLVPLLIAATEVEPGHYFPSVPVQNMFSTSGFGILTRSISGVIGAHGQGQFFLMSAAAIKIQIFIAFCYTYHYLNWFSKTSVIGWSRQLSKGKLALVLLIWLGSMFLYWYDYKTGFIALLFLSFVHVLLEFPLNITSIKGIVRSISRKATLQQRPVKVFSNVPTLKKGTRKS